MTRRTGPDARTAIRGVILRALAPGLVLWLAIAGFGELLTGPLKGWNRSESNLNRSLQDNGGGRDRSPTPGGPPPGPGPTNSSYPSGHVGASLALYTSLAIMATTIERTLLRRALIAVCSVIPILVSYARLYRGMHHLSDVLVGAINGLICAGLAAHWARESHRTRPTSIGT